MEIIDEITQGDYKYGFVTDIESDNAPKGLNEDIIKFISAKKRTAMDVRLQVNGLQTLVQFNRT